MEGIKEMEGKKVFIKTNSHRQYTGIIKSIDKDLGFLQLIDKYQEIVWINFKDIGFIQEERK